MLRPATPPGAPAALDPSSRQGPREIFQDFQNFGSEPHAS